MGNFGHVKSPVVRNNNPISFQCQAKERQNYYILREYKFFENVARTE
jgi:hypothetical protein